MSLRRRIALIAGLSVGVSVALGALVAYLAARSELRGQVDERLLEQAALVARMPPPSEGEGAPIEVPPPPDPEVGRPLFFQLIGPGGDVLAERGPLVGAAPELLPAPSAAGAGEARFHDTEINGTHVRVISVPTPFGFTVQSGRSLESVDETLSELATVLILIALAGAGLAALAARWLAGRILAPVAGLTSAAEHITETEDLSRRIEASGEDEVGRLASRFNSMLDRLQASRAQLAESHEHQQRLIADASHELRTPITSLRTNLELLAGGRLEPADRERALTDAVAQSEELGEIVEDVIDLARGEPPADERDWVRLDELAAESVERARRHAPAVEFSLVAEPTEVEGSPERIARALNNLLDNAAQHAGDGPVEIAVADAAVVVRDHGPGVDPTDAEKIFDRFHRGTGARKRPGSGLGLAIVRQVAESHGGSVSVRQAEGGGAEFTLRFA